MARIVRSALFRRQFLDIITGYRVRAGSSIAVKFVDCTEECINFIAARPLACAVYTRVAGKEFRKWRVRNFPVSVFFRIENEKTIILDAIYANRMNIETRLRDETI